MFGYLTFLCGLALFGGASIAFANVIVDGVDVTHFRTKCTDVPCPEIKCAFPLINKKNPCCMTCENDFTTDTPTITLPTISIPSPRPTLPPPPGPQSCPSNETGEVLCPEIYCPRPIVGCDCCPRCNMDCRLVRCGRAPCPNPIIPPGDCCPSCENDCTLVDCLPLNCTDQVYKPGACCPTCRDDVEDKDLVPESGPYCPDTFCPNPISCPGGCNVCKQDCRVVLCVRPSCPNPIIPPGECCGVCNQDCSRVRCPLQPCTDPVYEPGECCPACRENSTCSVKGCVTDINYTTGVISWQPDHCTSCRCSNNMIRCLGTPCGVEDCGGRPFRTVPGNCCPTCDYGISDGHCGTREAETKSYTIDGYTRTITQHICDKPFVKRGEKVYSCVPKYRRVLVKVGQRFHRYRDVTKCKPILWTKTCKTFFP